MSKRLFCRNAIRDAEDPLGEALPAQDGNDEGEDDPKDEPPKKKSRFEVETLSEENGWDLPEDMLKYLHKYMMLHISDKEINDRIVDLHPVPDNIKKVPELDSYIKSLLATNNKTLTLKHEKALKNIQERIMNILGPLTKVWTLAEFKKLEEPVSKNSADDEVEDEVTSLLEQTVLLVGQAFNASVYHRRESLLSSLILNNAKVKDILKKQSKDMNDPENTFLFGEEFEAKLIKDSKAEQKTGAVFTALKSQPSNVGKKFKHNPFPKGPLPWSKGRGRGGYSNQSGSGNSNTYNNNRGESKLVFSKEFRVRSNVGVKQCTPIGEGSIFVSSREIKVLPWELGKINSGSSNFTTCTGIQDSSEGKAIPEVSSNSSQTVTKRDRTGGSGDSRYDSERGSRKSYQDRQGSVSKFNFPSSKKGRGVIQASDKFEKIKWLHSLLTLQNGKSLSIKRISEKGGFLMQDRPKRCLFLSASKPRISEICQVSVERGYLPVSMSLFRSGTSTKGVYQTCAD